jgi:recombinational DNA repair protein RecR
MSRATLEERLAAAAKIKAAPQNFKVCESCGSIVARKSVACPNCSAYRFDTATTSVVHQADLLASRAPLSIESKDYI